MMYISRRKWWTLWLLCLSVAVLVEGQTGCQNTACCASCCLEFQSLETSSRVKDDDEDDEDEDEDEDPPNNQCDFADCSNIEGPLIFEVLGVEKCCSRQGELVDCISLSAAPTQSPHSATQQPQVSPTPEPSVLAQPNTPSESESTSAPTVTSSVFSEIISPVLLTSIAIITVLMLAFVAALFHSKLMRNRLLTMENRRSSSHLESFTSEESDGGISFGEEDPKADVTVLAHRVPKASPRQKGVFSIQQAKKTVVPSSSNGGQQRRQDVAAEILRSGKILTQLDFKKTRPAHPAGAEKGDLESDDILKPSKLAVTESPAVGSLSLSKHKDGLAYILQSTMRRMKPSKSVFGTTSSSQNTPHSSKTSSQNKGRNQSHGAGQKGRQERVSNAFKSAQKKRAMPTQAYLESVNKGNVRESIFRPSFSYLEKNASVLQMKKSNAIVKTEVTEITDDDL